MEKSAKDESRSAKLGVNALTLLALSEFVAAASNHHSQHDIRDTRLEYYMDVAKDLADYILATQNSDGSFVQKIQHFPEFVSAVLKRKVTGEQLRSSWPPNHA